MDSYASLEVKIVRLEEELSQSKKDTEAMDRKIAQKDKELHKREVEVEQSRRYVDQL